MGLFCCSIFIPSKIFLLVVNAFVMDMHHTADDMKHCLKYAEVVVFCLCFNYYK